MAAYSHGLVEIANRITRLVPKTDEERDMMLRDQFVENLRPSSMGIEKADRIRRRHRLPVVKEGRDAVGRRS